MKSVKFSSLIKQFKRSEFKVTTKVLRNRLNIARKSYRLSKAYGKAFYWRGRKKFALKITMCPESNFCSLIRMGPESSCKSVLFS